VASAVQALLYLPGVSAVGFATQSAAFAFRAVTVVMPALVFGLLYWKRGFGTAVLAHATALLALALMI
jgi:hypothetical protein